MEIENEEVIEEQEENEPSLRDTLDESISEAAEQGEAGDLVDEDAPEVTEDDTPDETDEPDTDTDPDADDEEVKGYKAPSDWKPNERELWSKVPKDIQKRIKDGEARIGDIMREASDAKKTHDFFGHLGNNYASLISSEGMSSPQQAVQGMFETVSLLKNGSPQDKALRMAAMIQHYGIDIETLDNALVGDTTEPSQNQQIERLVDQRMQPVNQFLQQMQQNKQQQQDQVQESANTEVAAFKGEFLSDVRLDMADIIDAAASRGQQMGLQKAYDIAVGMNENIQQVLTQRKSDEVITGKNTLLSNKRNAASSVTGRASGMASGAGDSLRGALEDAWSE